jgi:hypothetical protein
MIFATFYFPNFPNTESVDQKLWFRRSILVSYRHKAQQGATARLAAVYPTSRATHRPSSSVSVPSAARSSIAFPEYPPRKYQQW